MSLQSLPAARGTRPPGPWLALTALPLVVLFLPSSLVLPGPLESNGWPGRLLVFFVAGAVLLGWVRRPDAVNRPSPAEIGCWILMLGFVVSYAAVHLRAVTAEEFAGSVRVALVLFPLVIVALGIASLGDVPRAEALVVGLVVGATFSAVIGLAQAVSPFDLAEMIRPPGMIAREVGGMGDRGGFIRVKGSATHPIEFGVISGAVTPLAVHLARFARTRSQRQLAVGATVALVLGITLSVTRSGMVSLGLAMVVYAAVMSSRQRLNLLVVGVVAMVLMRAAVPGLLGTIAGYFLGASEDDSVTARTDDYALVDQLFAQSPIVGHGMGTFLPDVYFLLDNQYLMSLVEGGAVLLAALLAFVVLALSTARGAVRRATSAADASRAQAVTAAVLAITVSGAFFDLFSFAQVTVVLFLLVGVAAVLWRDARDHGRDLPTPLQRIREGRRSMPSTQTSSEVA